MTALKIIRSEVSDSERTRIPTSVVRDRSLSFKARGVYAIICYLQQHEGVDYPTIADIQRLGGKEGRDAIASGMKELRNVGLIPQTPPHPATRCPGFVYVFYCPKWGLHKIGLSKEPETRLMQVSKQSQVELELVAKIECDDMGKTELELHAHFRNRRVHGEWFELSALDISLIYYYGTDDEGVNDGI